LPNIGGPLTDVYLVTDKAGANVAAVVDRGRRVSDHGYCAPLRVAPPLTVNFAPVR
jgi:hypothetical protein